MTGREQRSQVARDLFVDRDACDAWLLEYHARLQAEGSVDTYRSEQMRRVNPKYILRNYMAENAIRKAEDDADFSEINRLMQLLQAPFTEQPAFEHYAAPLTGPRRSR